ncbi:MAG: hypothetical protein AB7O49_03125 [Sphingomonadales bacterium]
MRNRGASRPKLNAGICVAGVLLSGLSIWWGVAQMNALGRETGWTAASIGVAIPAGTICFFMFFNFMWAVRLIAAARRGEGVIARWIVLPAELEEFRANNRRRIEQGLDNDWKVPKQVPPGGLEVIFTGNGLVIGGAYFGLATTGMYRFEGVQILPENPLAIEFGTVLTTMASTGSSVRTYRTRAMLRVPVSRVASAEAAKVLRHYTAVDRREVIVDRDFYTRRIRWGLTGSVVFFLVATVGFGLGAAGIRNEAPVIMAVTGVIAGIGGLVLAGIARLLRGRQLNPR